MRLNDGNEMMAPGQLYELRFFDLGGFVCARLLAHALGRIVQTQHHD